MYFLKLSRVNVKESIEIDPSLNGVYFMAVQDWKTTSVFQKKLILK